MTHQTHIFPQYLPNIFADLHEMLVFFFCVFFFYYFTLIEMFKIKSLKKSIFLHFSSLVETYFENCAHTVWTAVI